MKFLLSFYPLHTCFPAMLFNVGISNVLLNVGTESVYKCHNYFFLVIAIHNSLQVQPQVKTLLILKSIENLLNNFDSCLILYWIHILLKKNKYFTSIQYLSCLFQVMFLLDCPSLTAEDLSDTAFRREELNRSKHRRRKMFSWTNKVVGVGIGLTAGIAAWKIAAELRR